MFEQEVLDHHIERQIIQVLMFTEFARFTDLRPPRVDSNLFSYHLKRLIKRGYVEKADAGYTLSHKGMLYVDRISTSAMKLRTQPKIITMLFLQRPDGSILLQQKDKQPYINTWTLPYGKLHIDDENVLAAANREAGEKLGITPEHAEHLGDCYIRVNDSGTVESTTLAHIVRLANTAIEPTATLKWLPAANLHAQALAPAVAQIVASCAHSEYFFEEFTVGS